MSVNPAHVRFASDFALQQRESEHPKPHATGASFQKVLAASTAAAEPGGNGSGAARAAEILRLEMMRSALTLDATSSPPPFDAGGMAIQLAGSAGQKIDTVSKSDSFPVVGGADGVTTSQGGRSSSAAGRSSDPVIETAIGRASRRYGVDESLIRAVIQAESGFRSTAVSPVGARGLMQLMPATAAGLGVTDPFDPEQNIMAGTRFLKDLLTRYGGDLDKALAAYNWGPGNLDRGNGRLPRETRDYLAKVKKLYEDFRTA